jgi:hypothetical protein
MPPGIDLPAQPTTDWESLVALICSIVALAIGVMTLPTAFQMFFGRPKIAFDFCDLHKAGAHLLHCDISNEGIKSRFLRFIGVTRSRTEISAFFAIFEYKTDKVVLPQIPAQITTDREAGWQVSLPFSVAPARIALIVDNGAGAAIVPQSDSEMVSLEMGKYRIEIDVITDTQKSFKGTKYAIIGQRGDRAYWADNV